VNSNDIKRIGFDAVDEKEKAVKAEAF